ncbi:transketolase [Candidatus Paracaedibacter symbiosus]|uniref:transketolase n=1 Tax=Candidatus Paracaedibacter symbiosus TaxID=244582 RepID=UPI000B17BB3A|nr:transketolase [Candidatus Paracaedibacter symbiosus]
MERIPNDQLHQQMANAIRFLSIDAVEKAKSGHPGMPMGMANVATVLWQEFLRFDPTCPTWLNRDRFVLSAGHGSMLLYSLLYLTGYKDITLEEIKNFRQLDSKTAGHPEYGHAAGIETTTGPLGQGLSNAVGLALGAKLLQAELGNNVINHKVYTIAGDGDLMEGISQEVISFAGNLKLDNLIVLYDDNQISIDGPTDLAFTDKTPLRFEASHWLTLSIDGHDPEAIRKALQQAQNADKPVLIACKTKIAFGSPNKVNTSGAHGSPLGEDEIAVTRQNLNWPHAAFDIPEEILNTWRAAGARHCQERAEWDTAFAKHPHKETILARVNRSLSKDATQKLMDVRKAFAEKPLKQATRQLSQQVLDAVAPLMPELVGGSADLTGSNNTKAKGQKPVSAHDFSGKYIHYGVREHGMAAIMNGLSLYGGLRPYGGTFLVFSDYLRPALRLSALMHQPVIYVLTHDSIGLGEDGPTHQPIEHLAALRAIPNLNVFRPADAVETAECWELAFQSVTTPSVLVLTRQNITPFRNDAITNLSAKGGYVTHEEVDAAVTLIATGSEMSIALETREKLMNENIKVRIVSLPCWRLFDQQSTDYKQQVLGNGLKVAIEAASPFGWERYTGQDGLICGIDTFGASAPYLQLYDKFGLTADKICEKIKLKLKKG